MIWLGLVKFRNSVRSVWRFNRQSTRPFIFVLDVINIWINKINGKLTRTQSLGLTPRANDYLGLYRIYFGYTHAYWSFISNQISKQVTELFGDWILHCSGWQLNNLIIFHMEENIFNRADINRQKTVVVHKLDKYLNIWICILMLYV